MRAVIVYESMYGNTHAIANNIAEGLRDKACDTTVVAVSRATPELLEHCDLLVAGCPTHVHSLPRPSTRQSAVEAAEKPDSGLTPEPDATGPGMREWLVDLPAGQGAAVAVFDTRMEGPILFTGQASKGIARMLRRHGYRVLDPLQSFTVSKQNELSEEQSERARTWGAALAFTTSHIAAGEQIKVTPQRAVGI